MNTTTSNYPLMVQSMIDCLESNKAQEIVVLDVRQNCSFTDWMIICTGTSNRHTKALFNHLELNQKNNPPIGSEGVETGDWILIDFFDVVVHVMQDSQRKLYELEKLW